MNQAEYAAHLGISKQAVGKKVAAGKITLDADGKIDAAAADFALGRTQERVNVPADDAPRQQENRASPESGGLTRAKTASEAYKARLMQLRYEQALGNLVDVKGVADAAADCGEAVVRIIKSLAGHADAMIAASKDGTPKARAFLKSLEHDMLVRVSASFAKLASDAAAGTPASAVPIEDDESE